MYSVDTSVFMDWQSRVYPLDLFATLANNVGSLVQDGAFVAVDVVGEEIEAVGTPELRAWVKSQSSLLLPLTPEIQVEAAGIEAAYPELMDPKGIY